MNSRNMAIMALAIVAVMLAAPLCAEQSDAATSGDISLTLPDPSSDRVEVSVGNGGSQSFRIFLYNESEQYLRVTASTSSDSSHVTVKATVAGDYLMPAGISDTGHILPVDVTVSVDRYDDAPMETGSVILTFVDMAGEDVFEITVGIDINVNSAYYSADGNNKFLGIIPNTMSGALGSEWFTAAVTIVAWVLISYIVCLVAIPLFARIFTHGQKGEEKGKVKRNLTSLIVMLIAILAVNQCLTILGAGPEIRDGIATLSSILYIVIGALIAWIVYVFVITNVIKGVEKGTDSSIDSSLIPLFKMIGKIIIAVTATGAILAIFGVDLNGILVSAGVITLGITLGAQNILNQFFSGIVLLSTRPFKKGDFVQINGTVYIVRKVKLMFTEFDNWDKDQVVTIHHPQQRRLRRNDSQHDGRRQRGQDLRLRLRRIRQRLEEGAGAHGAGRHGAPPCDQGWLPLRAFHKADQLPELLHRAQARRLCGRLRQQRHLRRPAEGEDLPAVQRERRRDPLQQAGHRAPDSLRREEEGRRHHARGAVKTTGRGRPRPRLLFFCFGIRRIVERCSN